MHLHDLLHAASFNAEVKMQILLKLAFLNLNMNIYMLTLVMVGLFCFFKAAVFKLKLENIHSQMAVVVFFVFFVFLRMGCSVEPIC